VTELDDLADEVFCRHGRFSGLIGTCSTVRIICRKAGGSQRVS
jgi:hypothetical protein